MRSCSLVFALFLLPACGDGSDPEMVVQPPVTEPALSAADEYGFRQLRQDYHAATISGDRDQLRTLWADDAVLTTDSGATVVGGDNVADFLAAEPGFGTRLILTSESRWTVSVHGDTADCAFETIVVDVGTNDPTATLLSSGGAQNPDVEIVAHTHSVGLAARADDGHWVFRELSSGPGPLAGAMLAGVVVEADPMLDEDDLGFQRMRERFHLANILGDRELLRTVWADDSVFHGGGMTFEGGDAITEFMAGSPAFGRMLVLTPESSSRLVVNGDSAEYAFECITVDVGDGDPLSTELCSPDGTQSPTVEIVRHTHTSGFAARLPDGRWVFKEFNGGEGPLEPAPE